jgi:hypothetical protein
MTTAPLSTPALSSRPAPSRAPAVAFVTAVGALALIGVALALMFVVRGPGAAGPGKLPDGPFELAQDIPASFGVVAIEHVDKLAGLTARQLAGATHGIQNLVPPDKQQIQAQGAITNLTERPVAYSPQQFFLVTRKNGRDSKPIPLSSASVKPGTLQPDASIDVRLSFVAPRDGSQVFIGFNDPGRSKPILIDAGKTSRTPEGAFNGYFHKH